MTQVGALKEPRRMALPASSRLEELVARLNGTGRREFLEQLLAALKKAQKENDLTPVRDLIAAWEATLDDSLRAAEA